jgi:hypothetical protein
MSLKVYSQPNKVKLQKIGKKGLCSNGLPVVDIQYDRSTGNKIIKNKNKKNKTPLPAIVAEQAE